MRKFTLFFLLITIYQSVVATTYKEESVLNSGNWIKISTTSKGIYKITYDQLSEWGIASPQNVAIYSNGGYMLPKMNNEYYPDDLEKIPVLRATDANGDSCVFFYSSGSVEWSYDEEDSIFEHTLNLYSDETYFFLTSDIEKSEPPSDKKQPEKADTTVNYFNDFQLYEEENINLEETGSIWYSDKITSSYSNTYNFTLSNILNDQEGTLTISAGAAATSSSQYEVKVNNTTVGTFSFSSADQDEVEPSEKTFKFVPSSSVSIKLTYTASATSATSWVDFITINYNSSLNLDDCQLSFQNSKALNHQTIAYQIEAASTNNPVIWDVSDPVQPYNISFEKTNNTISFTDSGKVIPFYVLFDTEKDGFSEPEFVEEVENQNLHGLSSYNMIIVSHEDFVSAAETLAEFHRENDSMSVLVLTLDEIYNEFSSGLPDVAGIRNMVRMFYTRGTASGTSLKYLLLMGDGSYNNRNFDGTYPNYIPTYQSDFDVSSQLFVSDDFFVLLDEDEGELSGLIDVGVGRIPCQTVDEAEIVVDKTMNYSSSESFGSWKNVTTFIADDEESNEFMKQTDILIDTMLNHYSGIYINKIYLDAYTQVSSSSGDTYPEVNEAINQRINEGTFIVNYVGHANEKMMASEGVMEISDVNSWSNDNKFPIFVTATCDFSRFDYDETSIGEEILLQEASGGVALFSTTREVYSSGNFKLSKNFYKNIFSKDEEGNLLRLGDIMRLAKNATTSDSYNKRSFTLLGDPALRLAFPKYDVVTKTINETSTTDTITIGALEKVTVTGEITNANDELLSDFNGEAIITVYDKATDVQTLGNDGDPYEYTVQDNIIYKGVSSVTNGEFSFSFVVPKDISYSKGTGKILYYAYNDENDGNGSFEKFIISGSSDNSVEEDDPPEMNVYLNSEDFQNYDKVASSSLLYVDLYDESGINTTGTGIGHDIVAIIDDDEVNQIVLNDYYTAQTDTYQKGQVLYPLTDLETGEHTILVKAWDVQNNSVSEEITFIVKDGFKVLSVYNAPNPVESYTVFNIEHNLPGDSFDTKVELYNLMGKKIDEVEETISSYETTNISIEWDVPSTGYLLPRSYIVYKVTLENQNGEIATGAGKLIINN